MKIIIDTHIFLWALASPSKIETQKLNILESPTNIIYVSSITIAEIMIKASIGKLQINFDPVDLAKQSGFELLDFSGQDALQLKDLPFHHRDPFDRMLISQSLTLKYPLMTDDVKIKLYECKVI
ncbi:type II toxin-antitoxin system VapC family toxin [Desulfopila sp. IMCC35006]|uniref:type II toxin-antitoxin system VapC family toxin n=1 Tax=Desulfopila sp. IMCC35006 TaxID=2569542 RepID=UPI0010ABD6D5|nr:type II toxin-antitoxin system VapC family toxin [Desulfopila sp. IMCC35006]TKB25016.1 type II toxin-antitoxin system VapC family toxin [Desulfopila sp. IMCC35006]